MRDAMSDDAKRLKQKIDVEKPAAPKPAGKRKTAQEVGGRKGPEPTRYGDWERKGICVDF